VTLVDTSVWVNHLRRGDARLAQLLTGGEVGLHPFVLGEIAAGNLKNRTATLGYLAFLPQAPLAPEGEVHGLLESRRLWGTGLGWVDLHVLASAAIAGWNLYTADRRMMGAAEAMGIAVRRTLLLQWQGLSIDRPR
jgi:predicted nucleic acid-binding protein